MQWRQKQIESWGGGRSGLDFIRNLDKQKTKGSSVKVIYNYVKKSRGGGAKPPSPGTDAYDYDMCNSLHSFTASWKFSIC